MGINSKRSNNIRNVNLTNEDILTFPNNLLAKFHRFKVMSRKDKILTYSARKNRTKFTFKASIRQFIA